MMGIVSLHIVTDNGNKELSLLIFSFRGAYLPSTWLQLKFTRIANKINKFTSHVFVVTYQRAALSE